MFELINTPERISRIEAFTVSLRLVPVDSTHRVIAQMSDEISVDIFDWIEFMGSLQERFEDGQLTGLADVLTDEIQTALILGHVLFADEERLENIGIECMGNIVVGYNDEFFEFYELKAD